MYLKEELYALIKSDESIFDFIQESALDGLWYWDLKNPENEWMNTKFWTVLGYHPDEMPHKSSAWQNIINQDDLTVANENFVQHCADQNHPYDQIVRYTHKTGSTVWIRCRGMAIRDKDGKPIRMLGAHQDVTELKRGEQELVKAGEKVLESEGRYRAFYNNAPLSYQSLDANGCFIDINPMWSKTLGYERDEVIGKWYGDFLHPHYVEHFRISFPAFKKRGYISDVQFKLRRKDNTYIYVSFEGCVGYTPEGKFRQTYCVFKDITEQKALENAIRKAKEKAEESEAKLNALFTSMSEMVVLHELVFDENGEPVNYRITDCNDAFTRITGITRKNAIGRLSTEVYGTEQPPYLKEFSEVALTGEPSHYETYFQPMDKHFSISVISPEKNSFATVTTDITKIKQSELFLQNNNEEIAAQNEELAAQNLELNQANQKIIEAKEKAEESEQKYRLFTEFAADVVWVLNLTTEKFTYISPSIFQLRGFTVEEAMHERLQDTMTPESLKIVKNAIAKNTKSLIDHPDAHNYYMNEIQQTCKNGQIIWVEISTKFRYSPTGDIVVVGVSRNIDERKRAEEALRQEKVFQETLLDLTKGFLNTSLVDFDTVVEAMLGKAGEFSKVDRVYVFKHNHLRRVTSNSHEWCKEGITPEKENLQEIPFDFFSDMLDAWEKGEMVHIPSVTQMPEEHAMRAILINQGIQSLILIPLNQGEKNIGFIGFDVVDQCKSFTEQEIALLLVMAEIISNAFTRKRAEEELKKSKELLSETESIGKVGGWSFNIDTMEQKWTDEVYRIHEVEISPEPSVDVGINYYTRESKPIIEKAVQRAIEHGEDYDLELEITTAKGNTRAVHTIGKADLKNRRIHGFFQDITERTQAEERLKLLNRAVEASSVAVEITDAEGNINYVNPFFTELTEYSYEEAFGQNPRFLKSGNHPQTFYEDLWKTILSGKDWTGDFQNKKKNGQLYWERAIISPILNSTGKVANFVAIKEDITEHKRFEDTWKLLLEISQLATKSITPTSFLAEVHQKLKKIIRSDNFYVALYNEADQTFTLPYHVDEYDKLELNKDYDFRNSFTDRVLRTNQSLIVTPDYQLSSEKDGRTDEYGNQLSVWLGVPFKSTEGSKPNGVIAIQDYQNRDPYTETDKSIMEIIAHSIGSFIERIKYIEDLLQARKKAEESDRLKSAFLANMSHEIRTPMNGILGFADLLKNPNLTGEKLQKYISIIEKSGDRMLNIINDIVDISKIEAGLMTSDIKEAIINEQTEYVYTFFKPEAEAKGIKFSFKNTLPQKEAIIKTDREKLYAILTNLVKNAIKYTREGAIEFGYHLKKHNEFVELEFYVKDTGIGIPIGRQEVIFERFIQADIADKMAYQGAGLGLAITKAYVEMLGGKIWVESEEGIGSTFYFTLPYRGKPVKETIDQQHEPLGKSEATRKLKILIAEDDEVSGILIESYIKMFGNETLKAKTGIEAIEACRNNPDIDLVLMDIRMPGMEGYEATKQIREFNREVIIIAQTAYGLTGDRGKSLEAGCNDYIAKPINKTELQAMIQKHFGE